METKTIHGAHILVTFQTKMEFKLTADVDANFS